MSRSGRRRLGSRVFIGLCTLLCLTLAGLASPGPDLGELLHYNLNYSGFSLGYLKIEVARSMALSEFFETGAGQPYRDFFQNVPYAQSLTGNHVIWIKVVSNVADLDKYEDIYLLSGSGTPLIFRQISQQNQETLTLTHPLTFQTRLTLPDGSVQEKQFKQPVFDAVSLFYYLRKQDYSQAYPLALIDQEFTFRKAGTPMIHYRGHDVETIMVKSDPAKLTLWFTADERRLPVKAQYDLFMGSIFFELR